jgi:hypothetical protein
MILNLSFLTEGKLAAILIIPSSWGSQLAGHSPRTRKLLVPSITRQQLVFWRRCRGPQKYNLPRQQGASCSFSGVVAGEEVEDFCEGSFRTPILYFVLLFCFTLFILLASFYIKNPKKLESLVVVISLL